MKKQCRLPQAKLQESLQIGTEQVAGQGSLLED